MYAGQLSVNAAVNILCQEAPLATDPNDAFALWEATFGTSFDFLRGVTRGQESRTNLDLFYRATADDSLAATCHLTMHRQDSCLGGLGEVATADAFRQRGLATELCRRARDEFTQRGGRALFLGTVNPAAHRIYERLGWQSIPKTTLMVHLSGGESPASFLDGYFSGATATSIEPLSTAARLHVIPLCIAEYNSQVLDANVELLSTTAQRQNSCMGLYPKYQQLQANGGEAFGAWTTSGRLVGVSTVRIVDGVAGIDGFTHDKFSTAMASLLQRAIDWAVSEGAACQAMLASIDGEKQAAFEAVGFRRTGATRSAQIGDADFELQIWELERFVG